MRGFPLRAAGALLLAAAGCAPPPAATWSAAPVATPWAPAPVPASPAAMPPPASPPIAPTIRDGSAYGEPLAIVGDQVSVLACFSGDLLQALVNRRGGSQWITWRAGDRRPKKLGRPPGSPDEIACSPTTPAVAFAANDWFYNMLEPDPHPPGRIVLTLGDATTGALRRVVDEKVERVDSTGVASAGVGEPCFSPDGRRFAYSYFTGGRDTPQKTVVRDTATLAVLGEHAGHPYEWTASGLVLWGTDGNSRWRWEPGAEAVPVGDPLGDFAGESARWLTEEDRGAHTAHVLRVVDRSWARPPVTYDLDAIGYALFPGSWIGENELALDDWLLDVEHGTAQRLFPPSEKRWRVVGIIPGGRVLVKLWVDPSEPDLFGLYVAQRLRPEAP